MVNMLNLVLCEPQIPQNTGNISRTCAVTGAALHLIKPLGFEITDSKLKRAGLDYWDKLAIFTYNSLDEFLSAHKNDEMFFFSTKAKRYYTDIKYPENAYLIFGREDRGLPESVLSAFSDRAVKLPMRETLRSLNLSNSVAVAAYEALRQWGFPGLS
jgi:tRNA (cytidine/uridine-2'-O-)-methyltransferase